MAGLQIQAIGIDLKEPSDYPILLKLAVDGGTIFKPPPIAKRQAHWTIGSSINVGQNSIIVVKVREQRLMRTTHLATIMASCEDASYLGADTADAQRGTGSVQICVTL